MDKRIETQPIFGRTKHIHMVGIGGIGMSGMAEILIHRGYKVSGSDGALGETTKRLEDIGATIYEGHAAENIEGADVVVYTSAVKASDNEETKAAIEQRIPTIKRAEMLAELMKMKYGIGVAGTHGKTTTTTMVGLVTQKGNYDPTIIVGGKVHSFDKTNAVVGKGDVIVVEADEFDRTFLRLTPSIAIITNIEAEHLDIYDDLDDVKQAFVDYANKVPFYGSVIVCLDDSNVRSILPLLERRVISYGLTPQAQIRATDIIMSEFNSTFTVTNNGEKLGVITLKSPGEHNVLNALASIATGIELDIEFKLIKAGLESFEGVYRRFQQKYSNGVMVIDDYAHHPTEINALVTSVKELYPNDEIVGFFQPHLFTRTRDFAEGFAASLSLLNELVLVPIYPAREKPIEGINSEWLLNKVNGPKKYLLQPSSLPLYAVVSPCRVVLTIGAGDIDKTIEPIKNKLIETCN